MVGPEIRHPGARPGAEPAQRPGQPGHPVVQFGVAERAPRMHDRPRVRGLAGPAGGPRPDALVEHGLPSQPADSPSSRAALSLRIFSRTAGLIGSSAKSASQRSGVSIG